jgi:hypothetical protein
MVHAFPSSNVLQNAVFLVESVRRNQQGDGLTDRFLSAEAKQSFRATVPTGHDASEIFADDGVI